MGNIASERVLTGNHVRMFFTGDGARTLLAEGTSGPVGKGTSYGIQRSTGLQPIHVVGDPDPVEHVDGRHSYSIQISLLRFRSEVANARDIMAAEPVEIEWVDRHNENVIATAENCKLETDSTQIPANQPVARNLSFQALRIR